MQLIYFNKKHWRQQHVHQTGNLHLCIIPVGSSRLLVNFTHFPDPATDSH